ncbi:hypothetical protein HPB48_006183 [Haemaphysalis longicornis]|uniref:Uncharacterized protein n=1 Tax=Haemaphysalis longicornis TaxID=44386 RepID=A0A9J6FCD5_HAELO|nr:hypothetical protein HPB48_006183 [Haemaphysalis longicornis]
MTETLESLTGVRAYGVAERFGHHFFRLVDTCIQGYAGYCDSYRFTRALTATGGFLILLSALLLNTAFVDQPDPSSLGLALSAATSVIRATYL